MVTDAALANVSAATLAVVERVPPMFRSMLFTPTAPWALADTRLLSFDTVLPAVTAPPTSTVKAAELAAGRTDAETSPLMSWSLSTPYADVTSEPPAATLEPRPSAASRVTEVAVTSTLLIAVALAAAACRRLPDRSTVLPEAASAIFRAAPPVMADDTAPAFA